LTFKQHRRGGATLPERGYFVQSYKSRRKQERKYKVIFKRIETTLKMAFLPVGGLFTINKKRI